MEQALFVLRKPFYLALSSSTAYMIGLAMFAITWQVAKRSKFVFQYFVLRNMPGRVGKVVGETFQKKSNTSPTESNALPSEIDLVDTAPVDQIDTTKYNQESTEKPAISVYFVLPGLVFLIALSFASSQLDIFFNSSTYFGTRVRNTQDISVAPFAQVVANSTNILLNITWGQVTAVVHAIEDGSKFKPSIERGKSYVFCSSRCSLQACFANINYETVIDSTIARNQLIPSPHFSFDNYDLDMNTTKNIVSISTKGYASDLKRNYSEIMIVKLRILGEEGFLYFNLPMIFEPVPFNVSTLFYSYVANEKRGASMVRYATLYNNVQQYQPIQNGTFALNSCLLSSDQSSRDVYICLTRTVPAPDFFTAIEMVILAASEESVREGMDSRSIGLMRVPQLNVTAIVSNFNTTFTILPNNSISTFSLPTRMYSYVYYSKVYNSLLSVGDGTKDGTSAGVCQVLDIPLRECSGTENLYIINQGDGATGTVYALISAWHVAVFGMAVVMASIVLLYNDYSQTLMGLLIAEKDPIQYSLGRNRVRSNQIVLVEHP